MVIALLNTSTRASTLALDSIFKICTVASVLTHASKFNRMMMVTMEMKVVMVMPMIMPETISLRIELWY